MEFPSSDSFDIPESYFPKMAGNRNSEGNFPNFAFKRHHAQFSFYYVVGIEFQYFNDTGLEAIPQIQAYNDQFLKCIETIKKRHDPTTTTIGNSSLQSS